MKVEDVEVGDNVFCTEIDSKYGIIPLERYPILEIDEYTDGVVACSIDPQNKGQCFILLNRQCEFLPKGISWQIEKGVNHERNK